MNSTLKWLSLSAAVVVADQLTKIAAVAGLGYLQPVPVIPFFNLTLIYNYGAAFSFLSNAGGWQRWFFTVLAVVVSVILVFWLARLRREEWVSAMGLAAILGGAVGNLIDRVRLGYVIDFLDVYYAQWHWPAFNLADSAITIGVGLLLLDAWFQHRAGKKNPAG